MTRFPRDKSGTRRTIDVLHCYRSFEWIMDEVEARSREYPTRLDDSGANAELDRSDHPPSLGYVARLASMARTRLAPRWIQRGFLSAHVYIARTPP